MLHFLQILTTVLLAWPDARGLRICDRFPVSFTGIFFGLAIEANDDERNPPMAPSARLSRLTTSSTARWLSTGGSKTTASSTDKAEQALSPEQLVDLRRRTRALGESGSPPVKANCALLSLLQLSFGFDPGLLRHGLWCKENV
jgi:hypothetical protein